jgi:hypothetical protein
MLFRIQDVFSDLSALSANASQQLRLIGKLKSGPDFEATNCVMVANSANTTTVPSNVLVPTEKGFGAGDNR